MLAPAAHATPITYTLTFTAPILEIGSAPYVYTDYYNQFVSVNGYGDTNGVYADQYGRLHNPFTRFTIQVGSLPLLSPAPGQDILLTQFSEIYFSSDFVPVADAPPGYALGAFPATNALVSPASITVLLSNGANFATVCTHYVVTIPPSAICVDPAISTTFSATLTRRFGRP